jgi:YHS domain-containing protein
MNARKHFRLHLIFVLFLLAGLQGCSTLTANTTSDGDDKRLMLKGHDPVAYFTDGKHVLGDPKIKTDHEGVTYRFASEAHKQMFDKEPARYAPQYGGFCTNGIVYAIPWGGDPDTWQIINNRLYIFGGHGSKKYFLMDEKNNLELADRYWKDEVQGKNPVWQRYKRLVFRVPHYKSGKELEAELQAKQKS